MLLSREESVCFLGEAVAAPRLREALRLSSFFDDETDELLCFDEMDDKPVDDALDALSKNGRRFVSSFLTAKTSSLARLGGL